MNSGQAKLWSWVGIAVVVIALIIVVSWALKPSSRPVPSTPTTLSYASKGQLISGFPKELILDQAAQVTNSYTMTYSGTLHQYTAQWNSSISLASLFNEYQSYFKTNNWTISNVMTAYAGTKGFHAENATAAVGISIVDNGKSRQVTITYVAK